MKVLIIDNFDSFTYNLYQLAGEILENRDEAFDLHVKRNNQISLEQIRKEEYDRIIISPGPGNPADPAYFGICRDVILELSKTTKVLGVCLGMQGLAHYMGGKVIKAKTPMHGKTSIIKHNSKGIFSGVPNSVSVMRYHSLIVDPKTLPKSLEITAQTATGPKEIMGLRHKIYPLEGVQFHPESFATEYGRKMLENFLLDETSDGQLPFSQSQAYNLQKLILKGQVNTSHLLEIFNKMDKRELEPEEFLGFMQASRDFMQYLPGYSKELLDTCGTGGDGLHTFNISTLSALVCASLGVKVAKHGNRAASSKCGSADILEALGININMSPTQARSCLDRCGITFMFAPVYHPAFKFAKEARTKFGKKTYFNLLGPLLNPAEAGFRLVGVADEGKIALIKEALKGSNVRKALIAHGRDGMDEISPVTPSTIIEITKYGERKFIVDPKALGFGHLNIKDLRVSGIFEAKKMFMSVLEGRGSAAQMAAAVLNSAAGLLAADAVSSFEDGIKQAYNALHTGKALAKLEAFREASQTV